jgi:hypothetical protein
MKFASLYAVASLAMALGVGSALAAEVNVGGSAGVNVGAGSGNQGDQGGNGSGAHAGGGVDAGAQLKNNNGSGGSTKAVGMATLGIDISGAGNTRQENLAFFNRLSQSQQSNVRGRCQQMPSMNAHSPESNFCGSIAQ